MRKTIVRMLTAVALVGGTAVVSTTGVASAKDSAKVTKFATEPALYKISSFKTTAPPPGCVGQGCPSIEQSLPALDVAATGFDALVGAKKIDTYSTWSGSTTVKGGCAIKADDTLACWGFNGYGQLGNNTTTDTETPVSAVGIGKIIDVSTNGYTTCVVTIDNALKCVGKGDWPGFSKFQVDGNNSVTTYTWNNATQSYDSGSPESKQIQECQVSDGTKVVSVTQWCNNSQNNFSKDWVTIPDLTGVSKARLQGSNGWQNSGLCVLKTDGTVACNKVTPGAGQTATDKNAEEFDCDNNGEYETPRGNESLSRDCFWEWRPMQPATKLRENGSIATYKRRNGWRREQQYLAPTWEWKDSGLTNVVDFVVADQSFGGSDGTMCAIAGDDKSVICKTFTAANFDWQLNKMTGGTWSTATVIKGAYNAEAIYMTSFNGIGLCVYAKGTLSCGTASWQNNTMQFPSEVSSVAVMEKPISIFSQQGGAVNKVYFMTKSGILSADSWALGCSGCMKPTSGATLTGVTSFLPAEQAKFYFLDSVTGSTDNADYVPINLSTGERLVKSQKVVTVTASDGTPLSGSSVRWTLLDKPDYLGSSTKATDTTDADGKVTLAQLATGPVGFTLKGGTLKDGSYLQAGLIVVNVPASGSISVVVPVGKPVVDRSVSVVLTDGTAVPNAVITLRNNYLTYNYANNGNGNSSWSATAPDTKGFMGAAQCAYCFVPPPTFITGAEGKVTWKSFQPESRSSQYDAEVVYDDGALNQKVKVNFSGTSADATTTGVDTKVTMPFMAVVKAADTLPTEVTPKSDGSVEMPVTMKNEDNEPISGKDATAEEVCGEMKVGGLWTGTSSVQEGYCEGRGPGSTNGTSGSTGSVAKSAVSSFACASSSSVKSDSKGAATVKICPTKSGYYRVKTSGFLPSKTVCVKVNNQPCTVTLQNSIAGSTSSSTSGGTSGGTSLTGGTTTGGSQSASDLTRRIKESVPKASILKAVKKQLNPKAGAAKLTAKGACKASATKITMGTKPGTCTVTITQANKGKVKGSKGTYVIQVIAK